MVNEKDRQSCRHERRMQLRRLLRDLGAASKRTEQLLKEIEAMEKTAELLSAGEDPLRQARRAEAEQQLDGLCSRLVEELRGDWAFKAMLDGLPEKERNVMEGRFREGYPFVQLSFRVKLSVDAVKHVERDAVERILRRLERTGADSVLLPQEERA